MVNPYKTCHAYETQDFIIRLISENDAEDLLQCYKDVKSRIFFNSDRCISDFSFNTPDEMLNAIKGWILCYEREEFIRYSIVCKKNDIAIGTIEMFKTVGSDNISTGILRLDIVSRYEKENYLYEIINLCSKCFFNNFDVSIIITKAIPEAKERVRSLTALGFEKYHHPERDNYYTLSNYIS